MALLSLVLIFLTTLTLNSEGNSFNFVNFSESNQFNFLTNKETKHQNFTVLRFSFCFDAKFCRNTVPGSSLCS